MPWLPRSVLGNDQLPSPIKLVGEMLPMPTKAPTAGQHTDEVLRDVLGYDDSRMAELRAAGALG
jgi:crotonobetainyl-CoA:carnitine CoA-transferase CaiB-like acyl-CoA transferase